MNLLTQLAKHHKEWIKIVQSFGSDYPEDIVQEMYLRMYKYGQQDKVLNDDGSVNTFFIWVALRNCYYDSNKLQKIKFLPLDGIYSVKDEGDELQKHESFEKIRQLIEAEIQKWEFYDRQLFDLYRNTGMSMRKISNGTHIGVKSIWMTIQECKRRLREAIGDDYTDYLNDDHELIK